MSDQTAPKPTYCDGGGEPVVVLQRDAWGRPVIGRCGRCGRTLTATNQGNAPAHVARPSR